MKKLPCYLPLGSTLSELDQIADVVYRKNIQRGKAVKEKLYAILEAELLERIDGACRIIKDNYSNIEKMLPRQCLRLALPYIDNCGKRIKILQAGFVFREPVLIIQL